jgi:hypothetical protein
MTREKIVDIAKDATGVRTKSYHMQNSRALKNSEQAVMPEGRYAETMNSSFEVK